MLIVIEGIDGAGKSTQLNNLKKYLSRPDKQMNYLHFPRYDAPVVGEMISNFLRGDYGLINDVHPQIVALLFAEDRRQASGLINEWLKDDGVVLLDRYVYSNVAYQCAKLENREDKLSLLDWILDAEYKYFGVPRPDINIFLDVPLSFVEKKLKEERKGSDRDYLQGKEDIHELDMSFQSQVRDMYLELCSIDDDFIRIDCSSEQGEMLSPSEIFERILSQIEHKI